VIHFSKLKDISQTQILLTEKENSDKIEEINQIISGNNTLIITDNCDCWGSTMINFLSLVEQRKWFEINRNNIEKEKITILPKLLAYGGTEADLRRMYQESEKELNDVKQKVLLQKTELDSLKDIIDLKKTEISLLEKNIDDQKTELDKLISEISEQELSLSIQHQILDQQEKDIKLTEDSLLVQQDRIIVQKEEIELHNKLIDSQYIEIHNQELAISEQKSTIYKYLEKFETQKLLITFFIISLILLSSLIFFIYRGYKIKKKAEMILSEKKQQLQELNVTKDKFLSIISHDLKNPFNALIGISNLLISNYDTYESKNIKVLIEVINKTSKMGYDLLSNLLEWSKLQKGRIQVNPETIYLCELFQNTLTLMESNAKKKNITIKTDLEDNLTAFADKNMILTVIRNLVSNAIKFTNTGGTVTVIGRNNLKSIDDKSFDPEKFIEISVSDTGVGIEQEMISNLLRIDEHCSTPGTEGETGTGLGLILCKEFINKNGGTICIQSEIEKGSSFIFTLPK